MPIPETLFNANECQALLDYIEQLERHILLISKIVPNYYYPNATEEEAAVLKKLRKAGEFYVLGPTIRPDGPSGPTV
jgi:hypothetical protein